MDKKMSTQLLSELPLTQILENLRNLDSTFANVLVDNNFKGLPHLLLTDFVQKKLTEEQVMEKWNTIVFSGDISRDIKNPSLDIISRLKLAALIMNKLNIDTKDLDLVFDKEVPQKTLIYSLAFLIKDLVNKDSLRIHSKDVHSKLIDLLSKKENIIDSPFIESTDSVMEKVVAISSTPEPVEESVVDVEVLEVDKEVPFYDSFAEEIEEEDTDFLEEIEEEDEIDSIDSVNF